VQEFLGHSKIQTTFDVYGHLPPGSHDEVRERMDAYLLGTVEEPLEAAEDAVVGVCLRTDWRTAASIDHGWAVGVGDVRGERRLRSHPRRIVGRAPTGGSPAPWTRLRERWGVSADFDSPFSFISVNRTRGDSEMAVDTEMRSETRRVETRGEAPVVDDGTGTRDFIFGTSIMAGMALFVIVLGTILSLT